ncbi:hypothetical protein SERLA73DRAFT_138423 [Serpula lacrymans var. lacrymans S7.3]|uniref:DUF7605 domain-containing protein n=1 Tax=Serpula lacrymans var. lacrymans (strain S7.3) TaxID=936435 RepID=F8Q1F9_SERL3|nr:hypothetical protein SERLA73DRAFT_138423 [Serpula lacrymans var. lacrymans S7.3]
MAAHSTALKSVDVVNNLGSDKRYNTYSAIMRRHGEWRNIDFNRALTKDIFSNDLLVKWNTIVNHNVPMHLETLTLKLSENFDNTLKKICNRAPKSIHSQITKSSDLIQNTIKPSLNTAHRGYLTSLSTAQRDFSSAVRSQFQAELEDHYDKVSKEHGSGMFGRMKVQNMQRRK